MTTTIAHMRSTYPDAYHKIYQHVEDVNQKIERFNSIIEVLGFRHLADNTTSVTSKQLRIGVEQLQDRYDLHPFLPGKVLAKLERPLHDLSNRDCASILRAILQPLGVAVQSKSFQRRVAGRPTSFMRYQLRV